MPWVRGAADGRRREGEQELDCDVAEDEPGPPPGRPGMVPGVERFRSTQTGSDPRSIRASVGLGRVADAEGSLPCGRPMAIG